MRRILYLGLDPSHYLTDGVITHWPIIKIAPRCISDELVQASLDAFDSYSHIIITSKSTVHILYNYLQQYGISIKEWQKKITLAIGSVTSHHLQTCGINSLMATTSTAEGMVHTLSSLPLHNAHLFWPHSYHARTIIRDFLTEHMIKHTVCAFYEPVVNWVEDRPTLDLFDEIIFTSPSTVKAFLDIFGHMPKHINLTPIGPITAKVLAQFI